MTRQELVSLIDHTALRPDLHRRDIDKVIKDCKTHSFGGICVDPGWIGLVKEKLVETRIITVPNWRVGGGLEHSRNQDFHFTEAAEVDYIISLMSACITRNRDNTKKELEIVRGLIPGVMRVIIEVTALRAFAEKNKTDFEKDVKEICEIVDQSGANWIKTDSGLFGRKDPEHLFEDIKLMLANCKLPLKAAGGIRDLKTLNKCIELGAKQIGTSSGILILREFDNDIKREEKTSQDY